MTSRSAVVLATLLSIVATPPATAEEVARVKTQVVHYSRERGRLKTGGRVGEVDVSRQVDGATVNSHYLVTNRGWNLFRRGGVGATSIYGDLRPVSEREAGYQTYYRPFFHLSDLRGKRVLDAGTGDGQLVDDLRARGIEAFGVDLAIDPARHPESHFIRGDLADDGDVARLAAKGPFDVVFSNHSVFAYDEPAAVKLTILRNLGRLIRPGGVVRITGSNNREVRELLADLPELRVRRAPGRRWKGISYLELEKVSGQATKARRRSSTKPRR